MSRTLTPKTHHTPETPTTNQLDVPRLVLISMLAVVFSLMILGLTGYAMYTHDTAMLGRVLAFAQYYLLAILVVVGGSASKGILSAAKSILGRY